MKTPLARRDRYNRTAVATAIAAQMRQWPTSREPLPVIQNCNNISLQCYSRIVEMKSFFLENIK